MSQIAGRRRFGRKWGALLLLGGLAAAGARFLPREPTLLDKATQVVSLGPATKECFRLSNTSLLLLQKSGQGWKAVRADSNTGYETVLKPLSDTLATVTPMGEWHLSPDGKWLLWAGNRPVPRNQWRNVNTFYNQFRVFASALDGSRQIERQQGGNVAWLPDSSGWTRWARDYADVIMQTQTLNSPQITRTLLPDIEPYNIRQTIQVVGLTPITGPQTLRFATRAVVRASGRKQSVLLVPGSQLTGNNVHWFEIDRDSLETNQARMATGLPNFVHEHTVTFPPLMFCDGAELAPQADRLLWKTASSRASPLGRVLWGHWPWLANKLQIRSEPIVSLWVSQSDGTGLREIGHLTAPNVENWPDTFSSLRWSANGRQATFIFQHRLYTIPVP